MFRRISKAERERRAARAELETTVQALHANERAFKEAQDPFYIEQLTYQHAALCAAGGHCCAYCAQTGENHDGVLALSRCGHLRTGRGAVRRPPAARRAQFAGGAVCGLGALAVLGLLEPVNGDRAAAEPFYSLLRRCFGVPG